MMREIKFRAWASNTNYPDGKMFYPGDKAFAVTFFGDVIHSSKSDGTEFCWARIGFNGLQLMQYIGLKDKNGKEIYEGDIVKQLTDGEHKKWARKIKVIWNEEWSGFYPFYTLSGHNREEIYEIIGNIYENPELLNGLR